MQIVVKLGKKIAAHSVTGLMRSGYPRLALALLRMEQSLSRRPRMQRLMKLSSVGQGAADLSALSKPIYPARSVQLGPVRRHGNYVDVAGIEQYEHMVMLPTLGIMQFHDIEVIGGTEMLCTSTDRLLYDELAIGNPDRYGCKAFGIIPAQVFGLHLPACYEGRVLISHYVPGNPIPRAIHLCKDHSTNYFHWLFECLPRAIVALEQPEYAGWPLLVDAGLPAQNLQVLQRLSGEREIIRIGHRETCRVGELVFPGVFSFTHDNYDRRVRPEDLVIAPEAVQLLRERLLPRASSAVGRKLYIARDRASYRRMLNERQVQAALRAQGFDIVRPEDLSFGEQLELFSAASVIVGPTGAGLSNMAFAPPNCRVIVLAGETRDANFFIFGQLGRLLGHQLQYVTGEAKKPWLLHSDYHIDLQQLGDVLAADGLVDRVTWGEMQ